MKHQHHTFIKEVILHGDKHRAYKTAYPNASGESLKVSARRLYNRPEIREAIETAVSQARQKAVEAFEQQTQQQLEDEYATLQLKRQILYKMMTGELTTKRHIKLKDHIEAVEDDLSAFAILRAIELDTKLLANWFDKTNTTNPAKNSVLTESKQQTLIKQHNSSPVFRGGGHGEAVDAGVRSETTQKSLSLGEGFREKPTTDRGIEIAPPLLRGAGGVFYQSPTKNTELPTVNAYISPYDDEYIGCRYDRNDPNTKAQFAWSMIEQDRQREELRKKQESLGRTELPKNISPLLGRGVGGESKL